MTPRSCKPRRRRSHPCLGANQACCALGRSLCLRTDAPFQVGVTIFLILLANPLIEQGLSTFFRERLVWIRGSPAVSFFRVKPTLSRRMASQADLSKVC